MINRCGVGAVRTRHETFIIYSEYGASKAACLKFKNNRSYVNPSGVPEPRRLTSILFQFSNL